MRSITDYIEHKDLSLIYNRLKEKANFSVVVVFYFTKNNNGLMLSSCPINIRDKECSINQLKKIKSDTNFGSFII